MKMQVFRGANVKLRNWRQVTVQTKQAAVRICKMSSSLQGWQRRQKPCGNVETHTGKCTVTACRTRKVRKGSDFFYGKSSNENHIEGV